MRIEVLCAALKQPVKDLLVQMNIESDAVIVNQCNQDYVEKYDYNNHQITEIGQTLRGVGINRNTAIMHATGDVLLFSDQDIVYKTGYAKIVEEEFTNHPEADMVLFNIRVAEERKTYENVMWKKVHWYNCGRYGAVSYAIRREKLLESRVMFSQLFGGGAKYSAGEDSLFLKDLIDKGIHVYATPKLIGWEEESESTWFKGYDEKYFLDRGILYRQLYGRFARICALRFLMAHRAKLCVGYSMFEAYRIMKRGMMIK